MDEELDDFFDDYQRQHPTLQANADENLSDEMAQPVPPEVPLAQLRQRREELGNRSTYSGPTIFNLNPNRSDYNQQLELAERAQRFAQRQDINEAEKQTAIDDIKMMTNRPFTQADAMRLTELENGFSAVERDLQAGLITPEVAKQALHRISTPMGVLNSRKQIDEERRRQNELRRQDDLHARATAINDVANKARALSIEDRTNFIPVPPEFGGGVISTFVGSDGKEQRLYIKPEKMTDKPIDEPKLKREAEAGVQLAGTPKDDDKFAALVGLEAHAARQLHDDPFDPAAPISDVEGQQAHDELLEYIKAYPNPRQRPPAIAKRVNELVQRQSLWATRRRMEGRPVNDIKPTDAKNASPGTPMKWGGVKSADDVANRLKSIDEELARRKAAAEPKPTRGGMLGGMVP